MADVAWLAAPERGGRGAPARGAVTAWLAGRFEEVGLEPVGAAYAHPFRLRGLDGTNVVGILRGRDPALAARHVILSAHFDHLGCRNGVVHPGACDNAAGVAAMLAAARELRQRGTRRSVLFIAFDLEERGLLGSFAYADAPALPLDRCDHFTTLDMLGRKAIGVLDDHVFCVGW